MSGRLHRFLHALATGYAVLAANTVYTLVSIPLALRHLNADAFGVFALATQLMSYVALLDLGMSSAFARHLVDAKETSADTYARMASTCLAVQAAQGLLIAAVGAGLLPLAAPLFPVEGGLRADFVLLLRAQAAVVALGFLTRIFDLLLFAHQRQYVTNYGLVLQQALALGVLAWALRRGFGLPSLVIAQGAGWLLSASVSAIGCARLRLLPARMGPGLVSGALFRQVFALGRDVFLVALGAQLILASQVIVIARTLGTSAAAAWAVGTKLFQLLNQVLWRLFDYSQPALAEMFARGEREHLRRRFVDLTIVTLTASAAAGLILAFANGPFLTVWTAGRIAWSGWNDALLGVWLVQLGVFHGFVMLVLLSKQVRAMRFVYLGEGLLSVAASVLLAPRYGLPAMIACYIASSFLFHGAYGVVRTVRLLEIPAATLARSAVRALGGTALVVGLPLAAASFLTASAPPAARLAALGATGAAAGAAALFVIGLAGGRGEFLRRLRLQPAGGAL